jgi:4-hydroxybenzoate polyprenyltransferase
MATRSRPRAYLLLSRISNLPTVWTNVLAAHVIANAAFDAMPIALLSMSVFYTGGMFLNDAFDAPFDAQVRPDRPIPNGDVSRREVFAIGFALLLAGEVLLAFVTYPVPAMLWGAALAVAIVFYDYRHKGQWYGPVMMVYDYRHKGQWYGPVMMGACRALIYCAAAAGAIGMVPAAAVIAALVMWLYIVALTIVARTSGKGYLVPWLLAGICIIDAIIIASLGFPGWALVAAAGFVLTLLFQRVVPGT